MNFTWICRVWFFYLYVPIHTVSRYLYFWHTKIIMVCDLCQCQCWKLKEVLLLIPEARTVFFLGRSTINMKLQLLKKTESNRAMQYPTCTNICSYLYFCWLVVLNNNQGSPRLGASPGISTITKTKKSVFAIMLFGSRF